MMRARRFVVLPVLVGMLTLASSAPALAVSPVNDGFANNINAAPAPFDHTVDTTGATTQSGEPQSAECGADNGATVWYRFKSSTTQSIRLSTSGSDYDTVVTVWRGNTLATLTDVACNDDQQNGDGPLITASRVTFRAQANVAYRIQVAGFEAATGNLEFHLRSVSVPANDTFGASQPIGGLPVNLVVSNINATTQPAEIEAGLCEPNRATLWYRFSPPNNMVARVDSLGALGNTLIGVWTGTTLGSLDLVACSDDTAATGTQSDASSLSFRAIGGTDYYIQVGGRYGQTGSIPFQIKNVTPPPHDDLSNARVAEFGEGPRNSGNTRNATRRGADPTPSCVTGGFESVWYRWTVDLPSKTFAYTSISGMDDHARVAVYSGPQGNLSEEACGDYAGFASPVDNGMVYHFQVIGDLGYSGPFDLTVSLGP